MMKKFFILIIIFTVACNYAMLAQVGPPPPPGGGGPQAVPINEVYGLLTMIVLGFLTRKYLSENSIAKSNS